MTTPQEQKQRNEIGRLTKLVSDMQAEKANMRSYLIQHGEAVQITMVYTAASFLCGYAVRAAFKRWAV